MSSSSSLTSHVHSKRNAEIFSKHQLRLGAVELNPDNPFEWTSGWLSPIYCDNRLIPSDETGEARFFTVTALSEIIHSCLLPEGGKKGIVLAGVATGGINWSAVIGYLMGIPSVYVRSEPKGHGQKRQVEGRVRPGSKVIMMEDLISSGKSTLKCIQAIEEECESEVIGVAALFTYGFQTATERFKEAGCPLHTISDYSELLPVALEQGKIKEFHLPILREWRRDPANWRK